MARYQLTKKAVLDLSEVWDYTFDTWSERQADNYYFMLLDTCQALANGKIAGKNYQEINAEVLGFRAGQHIVFYRKLSNDRIEIVRILHIHMDLKIRIRE